MADRKTHEYDCLQKMGDKCTIVHKIIDGAFARLRHRHRFVYHHWEGIKEVARLAENVYGMDYDLAYEAAVHHVKLDFHTGYQLPIPNKKDYVGGEGDWPVGPDWNLQCPWSTLGCDKHFGLTKEDIEKVKAELEERNPLQEK